MREIDIVSAVTMLADKAGQTVEDFLYWVKQELDQKSKNKAVEAEIEEFTANFPDVTPDSIPEEVWEKVSYGKPLVGTYALYLYNQTNKERGAYGFNEKNRMRSVPALGEGDGETVFTPEQVEQMSKEGIKKHYKDIIKSIKTWKL